MRKSCTIFIQYGHYTQTHSNISNIIYIIHSICIRIDIFSNAISYEQDSKTMSIKFIRIICELFYCY